MVSLFAYVLVCVIFSTNSRPCLTDIIDVDRKFPERNREVTIWEVTDIDKSGVLRNAFLIKMPGDARHFHDKAYNATLHSPGEVLLEVPSTSSGFLYHPVQYQNGFNKTGQYYPRTHTALSVHRRNLIKNPSRQVKKLLLHFGEGVELDNKPFSPQSAETALETFLMTFVTTLVLPDKSELTTSESFIFWYIAIKEAEDRVCEVLAEEEKHAIKLMAACTGKSMYRCCVVQYRNVL
jgi:hypothetical protein